MLDIDDFKQVNDVHGHQQGDHVLVEVARVLRAFSRDIDEPARYGGEELTVITPETDAAGAAQLAERMREAIEALRIPRLDGQGEVSVTASFGVSSLPDTASDKGIADRRGRCRVVPREAGGQEPRGARRLAGHTALRPPVHRAPR